MRPIGIADVGLFLPELVLALCIVALFIGELVVRRAADKRRYLTGLALAGVVGAFVATLTLPKDASLQAFMGQIAIDGIGTLFKVLFLLITGVSIFTSVLSKELPDRQLGEYLALLLSITFGMFLMASANDLLTAYLGMEMVSIVSFAMTGYRLHDRRSTEAALKYVVFGGAASGLMLFGISLVYGLFGTTEFTAIYQGLTAWQAQQFSASVTASLPAFPLTVLLSFILIFAGIGYKIAVVPFHMWSPDVYEGAPTPFTGFLSVGPKAAGFALLMRFFVGAFVTPGSSGFATDGRGIMSLAVDLPLPAMLGIIAAVTMTLGNFAAIPQNNVKRLLAYSSIAHAGYMLMGFVVLSAASLKAVTFYLVVYYLMNLGAFTVCQAVRDETGGEMLHDFRGLGQREPLLATTMTIFLLSLVGLPPLAGFIGKFYLFAAVLERGGPWYVVLAIIGVLNSAVSLYYYMKIVKAMWLTAPLQDRPFGLGRGYTVIAGLLAVPTLVLGLYWTPVSRSIHTSLAFYRSSAPAVTAQAPSPSGH